MEEGIIKKESIDEGDQPPRAGSPVIGNILMNLDIEGAGKALSPAGYILDTAFVKTQKLIQPCGIAVSTAISCPNLRIPDLSRNYL